MGDSMNNDISKLYDVISPSDNEMFSRLSESDIDRFLNLINQYKLVLRDNIGVDLDETFGTEIECEYAKWEKISRKVLRNWGLYDDTSLLCGAELKSPKLRDIKENWIQLKKMCSMLSKYSEIGINCGGHVHVGIQALKNSKAALINFMKLWATYEHVIFRFSYGEFLGPRPIFKGHSKSVHDEFLEMCSYDAIGALSERELFMMLKHDKFKAVNFRHYDTFKTIEFRCPNGTLNPVIWQNNINLFVKMLLYSSSLVYDEEKIKEKMSSTISSKTASKIYVDDALEFVDLIFDNNIDKIYFLRQYLKSFEVSDEYERAKSFC